MGAALMWGKRANSIKVFCVVSIFGFEGSTNRNSVAASWHPAGHVMTRAPANAIVSALHQATCLAPVVNGTLGKQKPKFESCFLTCNLQVCEF